MHPRVSFIVPCYNLAHLLPECVHSILDQSWGDFEVIIMDDCSPDNTPDVANSFNDPRVFHVRNETNLRHLANYNKGIGLASGDYIWLISADDRLRSSYVLERYVQLMDQYPDVGFVFCPAMAFNSGGETGIEQWSFHGTHDSIFRGHLFLQKLLQSNCVTAPSGMVRKECYEIERFPLDMPYAGDWYLWCLFALHYDVAYVAEAMVDYRKHDLSFTSFFMNEGIKNNIADEIIVRWRIMRAAETEEYASVVRCCRNAIVDDYVNRVQMKSNDNHNQGLTIEECEQSINSISKNNKEEKEFRARFYYRLADCYYWEHEFDSALFYYEKSFRANPGMLRAWGKYILLIIGAPGIALRKFFLFLRRRFKKPVLTA